MQDNTIIQILCYTIGAAMIVHYWCVANFLPKRTPMWMGIPIAIVFGAACMLVVSTYQNDPLHIVLSLLAYAFSSVWMQIMLWLHGFRVNQVAQSLSKNGIEWNEVFKDLRGQVCKYRSASRLA